jgi:uncharacterized membrane protein
MEQSSSSGLPRVFRNQETRFTAAALGGLSLFMALTGAFVWPAVWARAITAFVWVAIALLCFFRWMKQGIYANSHGVEVRGLFTSRHIPWQEIDSFDLRRTGPNLNCVVALFDGTRVVASALTQGLGYQRR